MVNDKKLTEFRIEAFGLRLNAWGDLADKVPEPGGSVIVEGKTATRTYMNKSNEERSTTEITASSIEVLSTADADDDLGF
jgi:single-stranded DNA-binding protein